MWPPSLLTSCLLKVHRDQVLPPRTSEMRGVQIFSVSTGERHRLHGEARLQLLIPSRLSVLDFVCVAEEEFQLLGVWVAGLAVEHWNG